MNERLKKIRLHMKLSQESFGKRIGIESRAHISSLENGRRNITNRIINDVCREFNVNKEWLRTGEGDMFRELPEEEETAANDRFKELRKACHKNQEEWGAILGITRPSISDIESGRRNVTDKHIRLLCIKPIDGKFINEEWLRTGEGNMFRELPEEEETAAIVSDLLEEGKENPFYEIILEIMNTYNELSPKSQEVLRDASAKLLENLRKKKGD